MRPPLKSTIEILTHLMPITYLRFCFPCLCICMCAYWVHVCTDVVYVCVYIQKSQVNLSYYFFDALHQVLLAHSLSLNLEPTSSAWLADCSKLQGSPWLCLTCAGILSMCLYAWHCLKWVLRVTLRPSCLHTHSLLTELFSSPDSSQFSVKKARVLRM